MTYNSPSNLQNGIELMSFIFSSGTKRIFPNNFHISQLFIHRTAALARCSCADVVRTMVCFSFLVFHLTNTLSDSCANFPHIFFLKNSSKFVQKLHNCFPIILQILNPKPKPKFQTPNTKPKTLCHKTLKS
jgi:hypothetical protein